MDPHGSSWLLKRKRTLLSKSFQPIRTGTERNEMESGEEHDSSKDTEGEACWPHRGCDIDLDYNPRTVHFIPGTHLFCVCKFVSLFLLHLFFPSLTAGLLFKHL